ncbi:MAG: hypothetical protein V4489_06740 [Chlamydiota bacterium]
MIIILFGPSSVGKTSIAEEMLKQSQLRFRHIEADNVFDDEYLVEYVSDGEGSGTYSYLSTPAKIKKVLAAGFSVIWEEPFFTKLEFAHDLAWEFVERIDQKPCFYFIRVVCELSVCQRREIWRKDTRRDGLTKLMHAQGDAHRPIPDLEVDSTHTRPADNARIILDFLKEAPEPLAFNNFIIDALENNPSEEIREKLKWFFEVCCSMEMIKGLAEDLFTPSSRN